MEWGISQLRAHVNSELPAVESGIQGWREMSCVSCVVVYPGGEVGIITRPRTLMVSQSDKNLRRQNDDGIGRENCERRRWERYGVMSRQSVR